MSYFYFTISRLDKNFYMLTKYENGVFTTYEGSRQYVYSLASQFKKEGFKQC